LWFFDALAYYRIVYNERGGQQVAAAI